MVDREWIYENCDLHHTSYQRGYVKVDDYIIKPYKGRFGSGYTTYQHATNTSQYHLITYWILKEG